MPYCGGIILLSIILTPLFNAARGSLLVAALNRRAMYRRGAGSRRC